jgi:hypothetical protein
MKLNSMKFRLILLAVILAATTGVAMAGPVSPMPPLPVPSGR